MCKTVPAAKPCEYTKWPRRTVVEISTVVLLIFQSNEFILILCVVVSSEMDDLQ